MFNFQAPKFRFDKSLTLPPQSNVMSSTSTPLPESSASTSQWVTERSHKLTVRILHTNDMHASFDEKSLFANPCRSIEAKNGKCYGGFARLATLVRAARDEGSKNDLPTFFLNAGDTFTGSDLFKRYGWKIVAKFLNFLQPDAVSLGNHDFDNGVEDLVKFLNNVTFPVVTANLDLSKEPSMQHTKSLKPSVILNAKGRKIGVIGYLTPTTPDMSPTGNVIFLEEIEVIKREAKNLTSQGCDIIIALGHSGYEFDLRIAEQVEEVDLVIGGHSHSFLHTGSPPSVEEPEGPYPTIVTQKPSGKKVYVVQAYMNTKYLGDMRVDFDEQGNVTGIQGRPVLVTSAVPKADDVERELQLMVKGMNSSTLHPIGTTRVLLRGDGKMCRKQECNLGNLVTDAMVAYNVRRTEVKDQWTDAPIAIISGGSIRSSITTFNDNQIFKEDIDTAFPWPSTTYKVNMTGETLMKALEHSVHDRIDINRTEHGGPFLQYSGVQITYNITNPLDSRVVSAKIRCGKCETPSYENLDLTKTYTLLMDSFLYEGGDGYKMFPGLPFKDLGADILKVIEEHINFTSPIITGLENKITILE